MLKAIPRQGQVSLATYREVQAHLQQLAGVEVEFIAPTPTRCPFRYTNSQVEGMFIRWNDDPEASVTTMFSSIQMILDVYQLDGKETG